MEVEMLIARAVMSLDEWIKASWKFDLPWQVAFCCADLPFS